MNNNTRSRFKEAHKQKKSGAKGVTFKIDGGGGNIYEKTFSLAACPERAGRRAKRYKGAPVLPRVIEKENPNLFKSDSGATVASYGGRD